MAEKPHPDMPPSRVGLLGWPLGHSISAPMHNAAFDALGMPWRYLLLPVPPSEIGDAVLKLRAHGFRGSNVTIPHKQAVMAWMDEVSDAARLIGAVNTIIVGGDGHLRGDNTDWIGFLHPLDGRGFDPAGRQVLLLGAGGSARAVVYALAQRGVGRIAILNRTRPHAESLASLGQALGTVCEIVSSQSSIVNCQFEADLVVNTTPVGMWPHVDASPWPAELPLPPTALVYDLVYRPERTQLLRQAADAGCTVQGGLDMLVVQGAASFAMWTGRKAPLDVMAAAARAALQG